MYILEILNKLQRTGTTEEAIYDILNKKKGAFSYDDLEENYFNNEMITPEQMSLLLGQLSELEDKGYIIRGQNEITIRFKWKINRLYQKKGLTLWGLVIASVFSAIAIIVGVLSIPKSESKVPQPPIDSIKKSPKEQSAPDSTRGLISPSQKNNKIKPASSLPPKNE